MCRTFEKDLHVLVQLADKSEVAASRAQVNPLNMTDLLWSDEFETRATTASGVDPSNWSFQLGDGSAYGLAGASLFIEGSKMRACNHQPSQLSFPVSAELLLQTLSCVHLPS